MSDFNATGTASISYRIRIGVTGPRLPENPESLTEGLRAVLGDSPERSKIVELFGPDHRSLMNSVKHTRIAFTLLTTFEEGINRLAVQEMSKLADSRIQLILPFPEREFENEFSSESSKEAFRALLRNERLVRVPTLLQKDASDRSEALVRAHRYIVDHCDVLLVIGEPPDEERDFLAYANAKRRPSVRIRDASSITLETGYGLNSKSLERLDQYNRASIPGNRVEGDSDTVYKEIFGQFEDHIPESARRMVRAVLAPHYARASVIALRYQRWYQRVGILVYILSALAVSSVAAGVIFGFRAAYAGEFLLLAVILIAVLVSERLRAHKNWIETRFLAERIRSAMFLAAAGVEDSPM